MRIGWICSWRTTIVSSRTRSRNHCFNNNVILEADHCYSVRCCNEVTWKLYKKVVGLKSWRWCRRSKGRYVKAWQGKYSRRRLYWVHRNKGKSLIRKLLYNNKWKGKRIFTEGWSIKEKWTLNRVGGKIKLMKCSKNRYWQENCKMSDCSDSPNMKLPHWWGALNRAEFNSSSMSFKEPGRRWGKGKIVLKCKIKWGISTRQAKVGYQPFHIDLFYHSNIT